MFEFHNPGQICCTICVIVERAILKFHWLQWRHNGRDGVSNYQPHDCLLNRVFRRKSKEISKLRVTGLCAGNSPVTSEFPAQMASDAENVCIWWRHHCFQTYLVNAILMSTGLDDFFAKAARWKKCYGTKIRIPLCIYNFSKNGTE